MSPQWRRASEIAYGGGLRALWFAALGEICYRRVAVRELLLDGSAAQAHAGISVDIDLLDESQLDEYNTFRRTSDPGAAARRLEAGHKCFVARYSGQIVCACWGATENAWSGYLSAPIPLATDEAYLYDLYTAPQRRGLRIRALITSAMYDFYKAEGKRRLLGFTVPENVVAMAGSRFRQIGVTGYFGVGRLRFSFCRMDAGELAPGEARQAGSL